MPQTEIICPVDDPSCLGADDECHDACEPPSTEDRLKDALRTAIADFDSIVTGRIEPQAAPLFAKDAMAYLESVLREVQP